jgi:2-keto-4-pentenoate hydratase
MTDSQIIVSVADRLEQAEAQCRPVPPFAAELGTADVGAAYAVQAELTARGLARGRRLVGRKVGLTSEAVQRQLGVDQPDYGALFADMEVVHDGVLETAGLIQPKVEGEIAFVLGRGLPTPDATIAEVMAAIDFAVAALEIVDSRVADWKIGIVDTIADNGSSARFVLGLEPRRLTDLDLETCGMILTVDGLPASVGSGAACLGHPLRAVHWLARTLATMGAPLKAGDLVLSGALGPMVSVRAGQQVEARIGGFAPVRVRFG